MKWTKFETLIVVVMLSIAAGWVFVVAHFLGKFW
jgi:hypothetical protein